MLVTTYLVNLLCAVVECRGRMPPPEAYIAEYTPTPFPPIATRRSSEPLNTRFVTLGDNNNNYNHDLTTRIKRLFPNTNPQSINSVVNNFTSVTTRIKSRVNGFANAIPEFFNSVNRIMNRGDSNGDRNQAALNYRQGRQGRKIESGVGRNAYGDQLPVVLLRNGGGIEGYYMGTMNGRKISAYEGVPYAEPPTGNRRFQPPTPMRPWKGTRQASKPGNSCLQTHPLYLFRVTGSEDCLYANIYSPLLSFGQGQLATTTYLNYLQIPYRNTNKLFPVIVWIHGGSFMYGSGSEYGPAYLLDHDIILVTFNYRLGALGFLSTGDQTVSANNGLKDQALLIQWVHDNIRSFGGDPARVTISGQSAGAVSAHLHLVAGKITPYFQSGVSLSGTGFGFWPVLTKARAMRLTKSLAKRLNCPTRSSVELVRCLKGMSGPWLIMTQLHIFEWIPFHPLVLFAPVVEPEGPGAYLTRWPADAYANNAVEPKPWIFGQTAKEGHFETYLLKLFMQAPSVSQNAKKYLPMILDYDYYTNEPETSQLTDELIRAYAGNRRTNEISMDVISDMYTDRFYSNTLHKAIHAHSRIAPTQTYAYMFDYVGKYNLGELFGVPRGEWGSGHTEDCMMIFNSSSYHHGLSKRDVEYELSEIMTNIVSTFVGYGKPAYRRNTGQMVEMWENAVDYGNRMGPRIRYLRFGKNMGMIDDPFLDRVNFWERLRIPT